MSNWRKLLNRKTVSGVVIVAMLTASGCSLTDTQKRYMLIGAGLARSPAGPPDAAGPLADDEQNHLYALWCPVGMAAGAAIGAGGPWIRSRRLPRPRRRLSTTTAPTTPAPAGAAEDRPARRAL